MDWNWYFSSVAQSTAAIVGIFAAFIITKIVSNQATFVQKRRELQSLLVRSGMLTKQAKNRCYGWYNDRIREKTLHRLDDLLDDNPNLSPSECYDSMRFSPYDRKVDILAFIQIELDKRNNRRRSWNGGPAFPSSGDGSSDERELIDAVRIEVEQHITTIGHFLDECSQNPESSRLIGIVIAVLIILFFVGVVWPLGLLPTGNEFYLVISLRAIFDSLTSFKGIMLGIISFLFSGMLTVFAFINRSLKFKKGELESLKSYMEISKYSEYFSNYNKKIREDA